MLSRFRNLFGQSPQPGLQPGSQPESEKAANSPPKQSHPIDVTDADFEDVVLGSGSLAIVDFWADWCQPCTIMSAHMQFLAQEFGAQITIAALDVEENVETPARYGVQGLPTLIMFRNGEEIDRQLGVVEYDVLQQRIEHLLSLSERSYSS